jgi:hypothetical protein
VKTCLACQRSAKSTCPTGIPNFKIPKPEEAWKKIGIDITGPFYNAPKQWQYIVVVIDYYSSFPELLMTTDITTNTITTWLEAIFARYGNPNEIISDNGPQFISAKFTEFLKFRNIKHTRSAVYNPQENGLVEVFNRYLKHGIQAFTSGNVNWRRGILNLLFQFRATASKPDGASPAELFIGRPIRMDFQIPIQNLGNREIERNIPAITESSFDNKFKKKIKKFNGSYKK